MNEYSQLPETTFTRWAFGAASRLLERILPESVKRKISDQVIDPQPVKRVKYDHQAPLSAFGRAQQAARALEEAAIREEFKDHPFRS